MDSGKPTLTKERDLSAARNLFTMDVLFKSSGTTWPSQLAAAATQPHL